MVDRRSFIKTFATSLIAPFFFPQNPKDGVTYKIASGGPHLCLTINCQRNSQVTNNMLENMKMNGIEATWFLSGHGLRTCFQERRDNAVMFRGSWHSSGYLAFDYPSLEQHYKRTRQQWSDDFHQWQKLEAETFLNDPYAVSHWFGYARAPWGEFTDEFLAMCEDEHLRPYGWSMDHAEMDFLFGTGGFYAGDIVLAETTLDGWQMVNIVSFLKRKGWPRIVTDIWGMESLKWYADQRWFQYMQQLTA